MERLRELVQHTWGFSELRPMQEEAMRAGLEGRDALVVLPTGAGKSLCYQAPALVREGLTVVVSPLISLMKDQIDGLHANGVAAAMLASTQDASERHDVYRQLEDGTLKLLFVAPERLVLGGFLAKLERAGLAALVIDEAHCISHWGHDFRPEYRQLGELRASSPGLSIQTFTATATPRVQDDIAEQLGLREPLRLLGNFDRPNLSYRAQPRGDLLGQVLAVGSRHPGGAGIVYCQRRKDVEKLAGELAGKGVRCLPYHAGLPASERKRGQEAFQNEGVDVIVATVAFGMGIDRPDVRYVVHASLPKGMEQYSQETGRAGRDGLPSECVLLYSGSDFHGWKNLMERSAREAEQQYGETALGDLDSSLERLGHLWNYANGAICRHRQLVEYFGQAYEAPAGDGGNGCGACDVCLGELEIQEDSLVIAQKILSCVVRCDQRYGGAHIADVLRGAATARMRETGHDQLTTYGLLKDHSSRDIRSWIDQLVAQEHLAVTSGDYPTLYLRASGLQVMKGEREVALLRPKKPVRTRGKKAALTDFDGPPPDEGLFEHLRSLRRKLSSERGVPPYILFNDRTLVQMAAHKPRTPDAFLLLKGVGDKKAADLGPTFLAAIAEFLDAKSD
jgi:ATP-dependent DNA helicase RecQ